MWRSIFGFQGLRNQEVKKNDRINMRYWLVTKLLELFFFSKFCMNMPLVIWWYTLCWSIKVLKLLRISSIIPSLPQDIQEGRSCPYMWILFALYCHIMFHCFYSWKYKNYRATLVDTQQINICLTIGPVGRPVKPM